MMYMYKTTKEDPAQRAATSMVVASTVKAPLGAYLYAFDKEKSAGLRKWDEVKKTNVG